MITKVAYLYENPMVPRATVHSFTDRLRSDYSQLMVG